MKVATPQTNTAQAKYKPQQDLCSKYLFEVKNNEDFERAAYWNLHSSLNLHFGKQQYPGLIPYLIEVIKRDGDLSDIKDKLGIELTEKQQAQINGPIQELRALRALMKDLGVYYEKLFVPDDYVHNPFEALKADVLVEFKNNKNSISTKIACVITLYMNTGIN